MEGRSYLHPHSRNLCLQEQNQVYSKLQAMRNQKKKTDSKPEAAVDTSDVHFQLLVLEEECHQSSAVLWGHNSFGAVFLLLLTLQAELKRCSCDWGSTELGTA